MKERKFTFILCDSLVVVASLGLKVPTVAVRYIKIECAHPLLNI